MTNEAIQVTAYFTNSAGNKESKKFISMAAAGTYFCVKRQTVAKAMLRDGSISTKDFGKVRFKETSVKKLLK